jgi:hypothetical protein
MPVLDQGSVGEDTDVSNDNNNNNNNKMESTHELAI